MKKKLMLSFIAVVAAASSLMAQTAQEMSTPAGKTKAAVTTMAMSLNLTETQRVKTLNILAEYYNTTGASTATAATTADATKKRDEQLKQTLSEEQYVSYRKHIESTL
jgi:predicted DsbA family dithiol-disulfide isomerase